jgi:hypothetical protein
MPKDDGLVADVQSRASGALYNWNWPFKIRVSPIAERGVAKISS